jgi:hypothetical protein
VLRDFQFRTLIYLLCLTTLSVAQTIRRRTGLINNELERIRKETVCPAFVSRTSEKPPKTSVRIAGLRFKPRTSQIRSTCVNHSTVTLSPTQYRIVLYIFACRWHFLCVYIHKRNISITTTYWHKCRCYIKLQLSPVLNQAPRHTGERRHSSRHS